MGSSAPCPNYQHKKAGYLSVQQLAQNRTGTSCFEQVAGLTDTLLFCVGSWGMGLKTPIFKKKKIFATLQTVLLAE